MTATATQLGLRAQLVNLIGADAATEYDQASRPNQTRLLIWAHRLSRMSDAVFFLECLRRVDDLLMVNSLSIERHEVDREYIYCRASAVAYVAHCRYLLDGHREDCLGENLYDRAHRLMLAQNHITSPLPLTGPCHCFDGGVNDDE